MSYHFATSGRVADLDGLLDTASRDAKAMVHDPAAAEATTDHVEIAIAAALELAQKVGRDQDEVSVAISGHANPDHAPGEGRPPETVTITLTVVDTSDGEGPEDPGNIEDPPFSGG